jgi:hypothetical protein
MTSTAVSTDTSPGTELARLENLQRITIDKPRLAQWIEPINKACAKPLAPEDLGPRLDAILILLGDLPAFAFTLDSARRVRSLGFPSAAAIRTAVAPAVKDLKDQIARAKTVTASGSSTTDHPRTETGRALSYFRRRMAGTVEGMPPPNEAHLLSLLRAQSPAGYDLALGSTREAIEDQEDRRWWEDRIRSRFEDPTSPHYHRGATQVWREASGMLATLTRPGAYVRQWAIDRLVGIMREAEDLGADTTPITHNLPTSVPKSPAAALFGKADRVPFSDRAATQAARAEGVTTSIFGGPLPAPAAERTAAPGTGRRLTPDELHAAYAAGGTPGTAYRAAQLAPPAEADQ